MKSYIIDQNTRCITAINPKEVLAVYCDNKVDGAHFTLKGSIVTKLAAFKTRVNFSVGDGFTQTQDVENVIVSGNEMSFDWILDRRATNTVGQITFSLCFTTTDGKEWNTTVAKDYIPEAIEPIIVEVEEQQFASYYDILIGQLNEEVDKKKQEILSGGTGLSGNVGALLIRILRAGMYTSAQDTAISQLEALLYSGESSGGQVNPDNPGTTDPVPDTPSGGGEASDTEETRKDIIIKSGNVLTINQLANDPTKSGSLLTIV